MGNKIDIQRLPQAGWKGNENLEAKLRKTVPPWSKRTNSQAFSFWSHVRAAAIDPPGVSERRKPLPDWPAVGFCALTSLNTFKVSGPSKAHPQSMAMLIPKGCQSPENRKKRWGVSFIFKRTNQRIYLVGENWECREYHFTDPLSHLMINCQMPCPAHRWVSHLNGCRAFDL